MKAWRNIFNSLILLLLLLLYYCSNIDKLIRRGNFNKCMKVNVDKDFNIYELQEGLVVGGDKQCEGLQSEVDEKQAQLELCAQQAIGVVETNERLEGDLEGLRQQLGEKEEEIETQQEQLAHAAEFVEEYEERNARLTEEVEEANASIEEEQHRVKELDNARKVLTDENAKFKETISSLEANQEPLERNLKVFEEVLIAEDGLDLSPQELSKVINTVEEEVLKKNALFELLDKYKSDFAADENERIQSLEALLRREADEQIAIAEGEKNSAEAKFTQLSSNTSRQLDMWMKKAEDCERDAQAGPEGGADQTDCSDAIEGEKVAKAEAQKFIKENTSIVAKLNKCKYDNQRYTSDQIISTLKDLDNNNKEDWINEWLNAS